MAAPVLLETGAEMCLYATVNKKIYILDGYNLIHRIPRWARALDLSLEQGRAALLNYCRNWIQQRGDVYLFFVVFDGDSGVTPSQTSSGRGVRVVYSVTGQTADDKMLEIVHEFGESYRYIMVSDDRYVVRKARLLGSDIQSAAKFAGVLENGGSGMRIGAGCSRTAGSDDCLPADMAQAITESLMREWNA